MSHENVELARQMIECVNRADEEGLAAVVADDVECFPGPTLPEPPFRGREAFVRYIRGWTDAFGYYAVESCEYLDFGEYVVIVGRTVARGRASGVEVSSDEDAFVLRVRDGAAVEYREYESRQEALEAVGLSEWPMSQENVEIVRSIYAAWELGDYRTLDWAHPEIEFVAADGPAPGSWTGLPGLREGARGFLNAWEDYRIEAVEYRELDGDRVLVLHNVRGRGKSSGLDLGPMGLKAANLFHVHGGKVTRLVAYFSCERALEALGLPPDWPGPGMPFDD